MELKDAQRQACNEFGFEFEKIFRRGRPSDDMIAAKKKMEKRIGELLSSDPGPKTETVTIKKTAAVGKSTDIVEVAEPKKASRINVPDGTLLHNCKFDVDLAKVPLKELAKVVPDFLKKRKL